MPCTAVGLHHIGQTTFLLTATEKQRGQTRATLRGLARNAHDAVRLQHLAQPQAFVVTNDRGLSHRCAASGAVVLSRQQLYAWLSSFEEPEFEEDMAPLFEPLDALPTL